MKILFSIAVSILCLSTVYAQIHYQNIQYGDEREQVLDAIVPSTEVSKIILLIHGGAWVSGSRKDVNAYGVLLHQKYPQYAVASMDYRLGSLNDPGFPKQLIDVDTAIKFLKSKAGKDVSFALVGVSAGAHLSMLYTYALDYSKLVKVIVNVVGPADFTAWDYASNSTYNEMLFGFIGPLYYWQNPSLYYLTSPRSWVNTTSAKTISFYGDKDPLIPLEQGLLLTQRLNQAGVVNEHYTYPGGHGDWASQYQEDMFNKTITFLDKYF